MQFHVQWFDSLASTNEHLKELVRSGERIADGTVIVARVQTAGRGRQGRTWVAAPGRDLAFSVCLSLPSDVPSEAMPQRLASLPMAAALAVCDLLGEFGIQAGVKWPNDVLVGDRKICGILQEVVAAPYGRVIVLGLGVNVNMTRDEAAHIDRPATSLAIETGRGHDVNAVLMQLLPHLGTRIDAWASAGFSALRVDWTKRARPAGSEMRLRTGETGTLAGWGESGELLLRGPDGATRAIWSAELD